MDADTVLVMAFVLVVAIGLGLWLFGEWWKKPHYVIFSGLVWLFGGIGVFINLSIGWAVIGLGLGLVLLYDGATKIPTQ